MLSEFGILSEVYTMIEISRVEEEPETRDCENCKNYIRLEGTSELWGCRAWNCKFEPKEVQDDD